MSHVAAPDRSVQQLTLGEGLTLEELVDRSALNEMAKSFHELFGIPLRIFSDTGVLLADASDRPAVYEYLNGFRKARSALQEIFSAVKRVDTGEHGEATYPCFTGARYHVVAVTYDQRTLGRVVLGPFLPSTLKEIPKSLLTIDSEVDVDQVRQLLGKMPRAKEETVRQIATHLRNTLDLILFSGHKALLTSSMHLASVRESFRDLQEKNAKLQEAYDKLKELDRLKSNFLATVSHELRTPLTSIIGYSEMLIEGIAGPIAGEQRDFVQTIHEKGHQLLELISSLLDLSKLESGTMVLRKSDLHVDPIIRDVVETLTPTARRHEIELDTDLEPHLPRVWGDATRLRQIFINLTENAIKFTPPHGRVTIAAKLSMMDMGPPDGDDLGGLVILSTKQPAVEIRVIDTGIGIPDVEKAKVFDAFYQVDSSSTRQVGGTGLGLSIVKRLVEGHEGTVRIEDNTPRGSVFIVSIPCRRITLS